VPGTLDEAEALRLEEAWAEALRAWSLPEHLLRATDGSPWRLDPAWLRPRSPEEEHRVPSPARDVALRALRPSGSVLDVGCGAGAASLALVASATEIVAVDESDEMLAAFAEHARARKVSARLVQGRWPAIAGSVPVCDVVICHHVVYNVAHLREFLDELGRHARRLVVVELTALHPRSDLNPLFAALWGLERPTRPTALDVVRLATAMGLSPDASACDLPYRALSADSADRLERTRQALCLPRERTAELAALLDRLPNSTTRPGLALWWEGRAAQ
jgi:2-polyprenyl-3-methyl-5-hydroxy-6-metoxy-1,4-benzoquinol methylase